VHFAINSTCNSTCPAILNPIDVNWSAQETYFRTLEHAKLLCREHKLSSVQAGIYRVKNGWTSSIASTVDSKMNLCVPEKVKCIKYSV
ncbi:hypothetical protein SNEBB_004021, partial [Seison nebaliae]